MNVHINDFDCSGISSLITSGVMIAANFGMNLEPEQMRFLSSCVPVLNNCINRVIGLFKKKSLSKIECARLAICYSSVVETVKKNLENHCNVIAPEFSQEDNVYSKAEEIVEALFKSAIDDSQTIKSRVYGSLLGNLPFQARYGASDSFLMLKTIVQLSYDELCLLVALKDKPKTNYTPIEQASNNLDIRATTLFAEMLHLKNLGLFMSGAPFGVGCALGNLQLSSLGKDLCCLMDSPQLNAEDISRKLQQVRIYVPN